MAVRRILYLGETVLRQQAEPVQEIDDAVVALAQDMIDTMLDAEGLGLSAPQVGESRRLIVVRTKDPEDEEKGHGILVLLNPEIVATSNEQEVATEGCLSLPTLQGRVPRHVGVEVRAINLTGHELIVQAEGIIARALQHEIDHLNGTLFIDRALPDSLVWLVPDEDEEDGYREEPTTIEEVVQRFDRLLHKRLAQADPSA
ncbi:MAG: peptide deformylase [Armatimonadetes bacterium]|nr:peptide deformylase [Armatimonadota bacterium]